ncbi:GNAT family N-acetyltransferase [Planococcus sp. YIM B11945]|uniref:GNAT family N-acetyltransferase n=1 Tax=Planococcus sp. YIM B11945 TaxID=3435410 RepID=UPI003D7D6017
MNAKILSHADRPIKASELMNLYQDAGWWPERSEKDIENMLKRDVSMGVWSEGRLIGFARAITDGKFRAYIEGVVVHSECKKSGIGTELMEKLVEELTHIDVISLFCGEELIPFYEQNKFKPNNSQVVMHRK